MSIPRDVEQRFLAGERSEQLRFAINDPVRITAGPHKGRMAAVVSLASVEPEIVFIVEPGEPPFGDLRIPQSGLEPVE
jgi:hypothetical protein